MQPFKSCGLALGSFAWTSIHRSIHRRISRYPPIYRNSLNTSLGSISTFSTSIYRGKGAPSTTGEGNVQLSVIPSCSDTVVRDVGILAEEHYAQIRANEMRNKPRNTSGRSSSILSSSPSRWHLIDAKDQIVGRLASQIATILRGKHKPTYTSSRNSGDFVVVVNAKDVVFTGRKMKDKKYYWHTLHPGGLKHRTPKQYIEKGNPEEILRHAVLGMLPKNSLRNEAIKKLRVFPDKYHIYEKQLRGKNSLLE